MLFKNNIYTDLKCFSDVKDQVSDLDEDSDGQSLLGPRNAHQFPYHLYAHFKI